MRLPIFKNTNEAESTNDRDNPPNLKPNVKRNLAWLVWSAVVSIANSVVLWSFVARWRSVQEVGEFTSVMGLYALFFGVCSFGLMPYLISEISRRHSSANDENKTDKTTELNNFTGSATVFFLLSGVICAILMSLGGFLVSKTNLGQLSTVILSLAMIPTGLIVLADALAIASGRTRLLAGISTLENVLRTVIPFLILSLGGGISLLCASFVLVRIVALCAYLLAGQLKISNLSFAKTKFLQILEAAPTFGGTNILSSLNWQIGIVLLGIFSSEFESSKFGLASRFLIPVTVLMGSYANAVQSSVTLETQKSVVAGSRYLFRAAIVPLIPAILVAILAPFLSSVVLGIFFGERYAIAAETLNILTLAVIPFCLVMIVSRGLIAVEGQKNDLYANVLGFLAGLFSGGLLVPHYGAIGAAIALLISFSVMAFAEIFFLLKKFTIMRHQSSLAAVFISLFNMVFRKF